MSSWELLVPPLDEQQAIAGVLGALDDKFAANMAENRTLVAIRQALLPRLMSGDLGVRDVEEFASGVGI